MNGSKVNHKSQCSTFHRFEQSIYNHPMANTRCTNKLPMVFLLLLVCLSTAVCYDYVETSMDSCWRKDILRVKGLA